MKTRRPLGSAHTESFEPLDLVAERQPLQDIVQGISGKVVLNVGARRRPVEQQIVEQERLRLSAHDEEGRGNARQEAAAQRQDTGEDTPPTPFLAGEEECQDEEGRDDRGVIQLQTDCQCREKSAGGEEECATATGLNPQHEEQQRDVEASHGRHVMASTRCSPGARTCSWRRGRSATMDVPSPRDDASGGQDGESGDRPQHARRGPRGEQEVVGPARLVQK